MIEIKDLLARFSTILLGEEAKKEVVRKTISEILKIEIMSQNIQIKNNIIYLNIKPIYKNEVFLKKDQIFLKLEKSFGKRSPTSLL